MGRKRKAPIGPLGCLFGILYLPFGVIFELTKKYNGKR